MSPSLQQLFFDFFYSLDGDLIFGYLRPSRRVRHMGKECGEFWEVNSSRLVFIVIFKQSLHLVLFKSAPQTHQRFTKLFKDDSAFVAFVIKPQQSLQYLSFVFFRSRLLPNLFEQNLFHLVNPLLRKPSVQASWVGQHFVEIFVIFVGDGRRPGISQHQPIAFRNAHLIFTQSIDRLCQLFQYLLQCFLSSNNPRVLLRDELLHQSFLGDGWLARAELDSCGFGDLQPLLGHLSLDPFQELLDTELFVLVDVVVSEEFGGFLCGEEHSTLVDEELELVAI